MTDQNDDFAAAVRPRLDGRDVAQLTFAVIGLTIAAIVFLALTFALFVMAGIGQNLSFSGPILLLIETVTAMAALNLVLIKGRGFTWRELGWVPVSRGWLLMGAAAALAMYGVFISLALIISRIKGVDGVDLLPDTGMLFRISLLGFLGSLTFGAITVPIAEEFLFRGVLYRWLRDRWGRYAGLMGSSLVFALVHPSGAGTALQIFVLGLALAYLFEHTGSLLPSMVFHGVNNGIGLVWIYLVSWYGTG